MLHISKSQHSDLYIEFGKGNPRLLEWLEKIAEEEDKYNLEQLKQELQGKNEEFIREYLADVMAKTEGKDFRQFFSQAAVFRLPVEKAAFESFGSAELLETGVDLTLFEREQSGSQQPVFWVTPVIRESEWNKLATDDKTKMHKHSYTWYDKEIAANEDPNYFYMEEAVYHAMEAGDIRGACKHAVPLGRYLKNILLYRDGMLLLQNIADRLNDELILEVIKEKDEYVSLLLNDLGETWLDLGEAKKAMEFFKKALQIDVAVLGQKHRNVAIRYNNLGEAWRALGDANKAIGFYEKALQIEVSLFGEKDTGVAIRYNNLGLAWIALGDANKAIEFYEKALQIDLKVFGEKHPKVALTYNNLGGAWRTLGDDKKAIEFYDKALEIDLSVFGEKHPTVAIRYNNLGAAWVALGDAPKAIEFSDKALQINIDVYGENHPKVAINNNNLGEAWGALGEAKKAIEFYEKALQILLNVYGEGE